MKKNLLLFGVLAATCCGSAFAQSKINGAGRMMLDTYQTDSRARSASAAPEVLVLVTMADGATVDQLAEAGYEISSKAGNMAMVRVSLDRVEELAALSEVKAVNFGTESRPYLDVAREISNVDVVNNGTGDGLSGHAYTGKGVTVGLYDTGLDPNHAAFRDASGNSRVKAVYVRRSDTANQDFTDASSIASFTTDQTNESHGTHVLGIIAGTNTAEGTFNGGSGKIPFYGPSYEADLIVGCGDFTDNAILDGIAAVVNKAKEIGQPAVVNLSLGSNTGAHDPNSANSKFLDELGKDAIICISAGNEGGLPMSIKRRFTSAGPNKNLNTFIVPQTTASTNAMSPIAFTAEFWADTDQEYTFSLVVYDRSTQKVVESVPVKKSENGGTGRLNCAQSNYLKDCFEGSITANASVDASTNRYNVYMYGTLTRTKDSSYLIGVNITASAGRTVYAYVNTLRTSSAEAVFSAEGVSGYSNGQDDGTINGFGCGHNMISVGAYVSRTSAPYVTSGSYAGSGRVGDIADFSSFGETSDGRQLPHVCGPGAQVVSSVSMYWMKGTMSDAANNGRYNAYSSSYNRDSYWYPMQGTSMSSPFVAGVIGLWLQAWPDMNVQQCLDIIEKSSLQDRYTATNKKRWGAGKIDALAGLKLAIEGHASLGNVIADNNEQNLIIENLGGRHYNVSFVGAGEVAVNVYSIQGSQVLSAEAAGDSVELDASSLADGIYVVNVATPAGTIARKFVVK